MPNYSVINRSTGEKKDFFMSISAYTNWRKNNPDWDKDWSKDNLNTFSNFKKKDSKYFNLKNKTQYYFLYMFKNILNLNKALIADFRFKNKFSIKKKVFIYSSIFIIIVVMIFVIKSIQDNDKNISQLNKIFIHNIY